MPETTAIPTRTLAKIERILTRLDAAKTEWINEVEVCRLLNISKRTLGNYIGLGKIPNDFFTIGVGGNKFFDKAKIIGLK